MVTGVHSYLEVLNEVDPPPYVNTYLYTQTIRMHSDTYVHVHRYVRMYVVGQSLENV